MLKRLSHLFSPTSSSPYAIFSSTSSLSHRTYSHAHSARVSVWWHLDTCPVPEGQNYFKVAKAITAALESTGITGRIQITGYGDAMKITKSNQHALSVTGIRVTLIAHGGQEVADKYLDTNLRNWVSKNPAPADILIISDVKRLAPTLSYLRDQHYNVLVANREPLNRMWCWESLVRAENLAGRNFKVFSQDSFWTDMLTLLNSDTGFFIFEESKTRENMAYYLQKCGPSVLKSATRSDVLLMVDMLISKKKWIEENAHQLKAFRLSKSARITSSRLITGQIVKKL